MIQSENTADVRVLYTATEVIYNVKRHQFINEWCKTMSLHWGRT